MAFSPPEYCRLFAQKKAYQGGVTGTPGPPPPPPSYAPEVSRQKYKGKGISASKVLALLLVWLWFSEMPKIENTSWKVLAYGIYARVVDVSEIEFNKIDWDPVELSGKTAMISTKPRPVFWIDHLVGKSSIKRRTQVFSSYIIGEMFKTNELFVDSCTLTAKFSFCVFIFAVAIWPVTGQGFQNTKWPAVRYFQ